MAAETEYNAMSWLYHVFYGDKGTEEIKNLAFISEHLGLLNSYGTQEIAILDSSCGNGVQATALALNGYRVTATDISGEMIRLTDEFSNKHGVKIKTERKSWDELPARYREQFDIVFCVGNWIVHSPDSRMRENNLKALSLLLKENGTLVVDSRNWDKLLAENKPFTVTQRFSYQGNDYIPLYHWTMYEMEHEAAVEILFQEIQPDGKIKLYERALTFTPFTHQTLAETLEKAGLHIIKNTFELNKDWYYLYASRGTHKI